MPYERYRRIIHQHANPLLLPTDDQAVKGRVDDMVKAALVTVAETERKVSDRKLLSVAPMVARRAQGRGYPSETTNERRWSDGTVDYSCRFLGCDYTALSRKSVGSHWRTHVLAGEAEKQVQPKATVDIPAYEVAHRDGYTPRKERVSALAEVLAALDLWAMSPQEVAEFVLNWQHEQSSTGSRVAAEREDLTSDDVLNRIRALLDNGTYLRQQEEITELRQQTEALSVDLNAALDEANQAKERWETLRELMADA